MMMRFTATLLFVVIGMSLCYASTESAFESESLVPGAELVEGAAATPTATPDEADTSMLAQVQASSGVGLWRRRRRRARCEEEALVQKPYAGKNQLVQDSTESKSGAGIWRRRRRYVHPCQGIWNERAAKNRMFEAGTKERTSKERRNKHTERINKERRNKHTERINKERHGKSERRAKSVHRERSLKEKQGKNGERTNKERSHKSERRAKAGHRERSHKSERRAKAGHRERSHKSERRAKAGHRERTGKAKTAPVVYQHCNFGGYKKVLRHSTNWVRKLGIKNDDLSSIKVPAGKCVVLYQHAHYRGKSWKICGKKSIKCFVHHKMLGGKTWNDQVSSIKVLSAKASKRRALRKKEKAAKASTLRARKERMGKKVLRDKKERKKKMRVRNKRISMNAGYRLKQNALSLKTFCTLNADEIIENSKAWGVVGKLLKAMALKSKKSPVVQYIYAMKSLHYRNRHGIPRYVLRHVQKRMKWNKTGILLTHAKGKKTMIGLNAKVLGFEQNKMGFQQLDMIFKNFYSRLQAEAVKNGKKGHGHVKFSEKIFRAIKSWKGN